MMFRVTLAIRPVGILLLQMRRVGQHESRELRRRGSTEDAPPEALVHQPRKKPAVIEMRVCQHDGVNRVCADRERLPIPFAKVLESLEQTGVDEHTLAARFNQVLGAGDRARRSEKCECQEWAPLARLWLSALPLYCRDVCSPGHGAAAVGAGAVR